MAQHNEDPLHRTDANEVRFQETVPETQKFASTALPPGGQDTGLHIDKPTSVTAETGYGGVSGRGNDISEVVDEARGLDHKGGDSFTDKATDVVTNVKDLATGKKQEEASKPVVDQSACREPPSAGGHKDQGLGDKVKDFVTGQKPGRGTSTTGGSEDWPADHQTSRNVGVPSATHTDAQGQPIEGPRDDDTKKEGVMSKVMDKFHLGKNKDAAQ